MTISRVLLASICIFAVAIAAEQARPAPPLPGPSAFPIKNVVALMFENRAFDHMLGFLKKINPDINGLTGNEYNLENPSDPTSTRVPVSFNAMDDMDINPGHGVPDTDTELWGCPSPSPCPKVNPAPMSGFLLRGNQLAGPQLGPRVMQCFNTSSLPILSHLALNFALFDSWHASIPGPTEPNRLFALSGTSHGDATNVLYDELKGFPQRSITDDILEAGLDWRVYFSDFPIALTLNSIRFHPTKIQTLEQFRIDAGRGNLPAFSWIEPRWFTLLNSKQCSQHPQTRSAFNDGSVSNGEIFLNDIYKTLIKSPQWNQTALLIYYDEHGGLYDHVPPPFNIPNPDGKNSTNPKFDFTRLGVRVPAVIVSPWVPKGLVIHNPARNYYEHSSLLGTLRKIFNLRPQPLTAREAWAATFEHVFMKLKEPRTDFMNELPLTPDLQKKWKAYLEAEANEPDISLLQGRGRELAEATQPPKPLTELQAAVLRAAALLDDDVKAALNHADSLEYEHEGAIFVRTRLAEWLSRQMKKTNA